MVIRGLSRLGSRPLVTLRPRALAVDVASAGALGLLGDVACQRLEGVESLDVRRLASITVFDSLYIGGLLHALYQTYSVAVWVSVAHAPGALLPLALRRALYREKSMAHCVGCALVDNVHNGLVYIPAFFLGVGCLQGDGLHASRLNLLREWWPTYASCSLFWMCASSRHRDTSR